MKKKLLSLSLKGLPLLLIVFVALVFFYPVWLRGDVPLPADLVVSSYLPWRDHTAGVSVKNPITTDAVSYSFPMRMLAVDLFKSGQAPLWNPYILGGTPLLANFQSAPFSPTNFVYFLFDTLTAWSFQVILQHVLAAFFAFLLLRRWSVSRFGSIVGGVVFAFSGFNLIWSQWSAHALSAAFIPLILFFEDRFLVDGKVRDGVGIGASLALQILSGYPQILLYTAASMGLLWLVRIWGSKLWFSKTLLVFFFTLLGLGLAALQILPGAELLSLSQRTSERIPFAWAFLPWEKAITFLAPDYFGNHATGNYWGPQNYTSNIGFVGVVSAALALLGLNFFKKKKVVLFAAALLGTSLLLSFPTPLSVLLWKSNILGLQAGTSHRALVLLNLSVGLLAGFGIDYLLRSKKVGISWQLLPLYFLVAGFGLYALLFLVGSPQVIAVENLLLPLVFLIATTLILWIAKRGRYLRPLILFLSLLLVIELFIFGWKFTPFSARQLVYPKTPVLEFLTQKLGGPPFRVTGKDTVPVDLGMPYRLEFPGGYDAVYPLQNARFIASLNSGQVSAAPQDRYAIVDKVESSLVNLLNTKYLLVKSDFYYDQEKYTPVFRDKTTTLLENKQALPRAFMVYDWEVIEDDEGVLARLLDKDFPLGEKIILESDTVVKRPEGVVDRSPEVEFVTYAPQESTLKVNTQESGFLFVSETWYPGWKVYIGGEETKIHRADFAFRAVELPKGEHIIRFVYQPQAFYNGLKTTALSFAILVFLLVYLTPKRKVNAGAYKT